MLQCSAFSLNLFISKNDATGNHIPPLFSPKKNITPAAMNTLTGSKAVLRGGEQCWQMIGKSLQSTCSPPPTGGISTLRQIDFLQKIPISP
jgi:hypothetical protein